MNFEPNVFISYAHIDNEPLSPGELGWVSRFHDTLEVLLNQRLGTKANIWRDKKLQGNDAFAGEIVTQFSKAAVLISILTSRYLTSDWCTREVRQFCENVERRGGLMVDNKTRVFKVIKTPVEHRALLPEVLGYEFFTIKDGAPLELDPFYGPEYGQSYRQKVAVLASHIASMLKAIEARSSQPQDVGGNGGTAPQAPPKPSIYLAECSRDRRPARELLEAELTHLGYPVLPDKPLPTDELEYVAAVEALLARCALSIHLVGENYGTVPDGPTSKSVAMHQNELAVARCRNGKFSRLIWLPKGTRSEHPAQQAFIDALNQDAQAQLGADLLMGDIEELKAAIHATLKKIEEPPPPVRPADEKAVGDKAGLLYLVCDEKDRKATVPLRKFCRQLGFDVELPVFEGDAAKVRKSNQQFVADCDAVMLFYGAGDEAWKRSIDSELKKMTSYRNKPLLARSIYLAQPRTMDKEDLIEMEEPGLIDGLGSAPEAAISDFLRAAAGGGAR